jgi:NADH:quinone reductase (non-electrogenic)
LEGIVKKRIVILGGGFGGIFTAQRLEQRLSGDPDVEVALVNRENHFVFQPLLPEVAAGAILPTQMVNPIRRMLKKTQFFGSEVEAIRLDRKEVDVLVGEGKHLRTLAYDHLVVALGTIVDLSSLPGMSEHSIPFKNVGDAFYLRNHVIGCLEQADIETDPELKKALLTFVVVGGGFSGVETIGELQEMVHLVLPSYRNIGAREVRFVLVHSQDRILPEVVPGLGRYAERQLLSRGIEIKLSTRCNAATAGQVFLASGEMIPNRTLVCTVGNAPNPMLASLGCPVNRGRIVTEATLAVPGSPGVWALGDCASIPDRYTGQPYAPTAQNAIRQATVCADNIVASLRGRALRPFAFKGLGKLASIGGRSAVAEILGFKVSGFPAWWLWRTIYLMKLPGWERRIRVAIDWTLDLVFPRNLVELRVFRTEKVDRAHYEAGEIIVNQGEIGDKFYVVVKGSVEIVRKDRAQAQRLATLGPGEHFGEVALLKDVVRTATVRALEPTDLLALGRGDFAAVARHLKALRVGIDAKLDERFVGAGGSVR